MAGRVSGGSGVNFFDDNITLAVGDYIIAGVWIRNTNAASSAHGSQVAISLGTSPGWHANGQQSEVDFTSPYLETKEPGNSWQWCTSCIKITTAAGGPCRVFFKASQSGQSRDYFAPCATYIPAGVIDDGWAINIAKSLRGGWSSTAVAGDVTALDHQPLKAGVFKATAKTFATLPNSPVAGMQAYITDCNTATWGATAAGGGSSKVMVWYNGSNWTVMGK
jgi:hypothetical protein